MATVKQAGDLLYFTSYDLKRDRDIVMDTVIQNGRALKFAS